MDSASAFAGILVGQPTLNRQLRMGAFAALDQRIATRFTIKPMDLVESAEYLRHHLALAGREEPLFADDAISRLHRVANGCPANSTTQQRPPSSPPLPKPRTSSTTPAPKRPSPSSPETDVTDYTLSRAPPSSTKAAVPCTASPAGPCADSAAANKGQ